MDKLLLPFLVFGALGSLAWQIRTMIWEDTLRALSRGVCPRCHGGTYVSSCRACGGTGLSDVPVTDN
jgi:hypothetical protein